MVLAVLGLWLILRPASKRSLSFYFLLGYGYGRWPPFAILYEGPSRISWSLPFRETNKFHLDRNVLRVETISYASCEDRRRSGGTPVVRTRPAWRFQQNDTRLQGARLLNYAVLAINLAGFIGRLAMATGVEQMEIYFRPASRPIVSIEGNGSFLSRWNVRCSRFSACIRPDTTHGIR